MRRNSRVRVVVAGAVAVLACVFVETAGAGQPGALRGDVVKLCQSTGEDAYKAQTKDLLKQLDRAKKLIPVAVKMAAAKDPQLTYYGVMTLAAAADRLKDYEACEALYRVAMDQAVKTFSTRRLLESYGGLAQSLYNGKKYAATVKVCRELLELQTGDGQPRKFMFLIEDRFGDFGFDEDAAFDVARQVRPPFYKFMIRALAKDGKTDQALKLTDNLIRAGDNWEDRELKGWVLREAGRFNEAAKVYEDVLERIAKDKDLDQQEKDEAVEQTRYGLSNLYMELKQVEKAAEQLKWLLDKNPDDAGFHNDLGYIWADNDMNLQEAEKLIRKALELDRAKRMKSPKFNAATDHDRGSYLDSLGWVLFKQKKYDEAKRYLVDALKDPDAQHIEIFDHLGDTYIAMGQRELALEAWRNGLKVAGDDRRERERKAIVEKKIEKNK